MSPVLFDAGFPSILFSDLSVGHGIPAPFWFITFFKIVGFVLHVLMMNLWFLGLPIALLTYCFACNVGREWARRFFQQLPVIFAFGINFGIVPLLFIQTAYYQAFYSSTILMAWQWIAVLAWVMISYYCVYIVAFAAKEPQKSSSNWRIGVFGSVAVAFLFIAGITMSTGLTLMASPEKWDAIWAATQTGGAVWGTAIPVHDPAVLSRWLTIFGIAMVTTAVWALIDSFWLSGSCGRADGEAVQNRQNWSLQFASYVGLTGAALATCAYNYYLMKVISPEVYSSLRLYPYVYLTSLSCGVFLIPIILISLTKLVSCRKAMVAVVALSQVGAVAVFATVRQWIQHLEIARLVNAAKLPESTQWSPLLLFLVIFALGLVVCVWMVSRVVNLKK